MTSQRRAAACVCGLFIVALAVAVAPAGAQEFRGSIVGTVTDQSSGVLPGVTVTVTNTATGVSQNVVTNTEGSYQVRYLISGTYSVIAELSGFKKVVREGNQVRVGDVTRVDIALEAGGVQETITVVGATPLLNTESGISGTTIDSKQIEQLPLGDGTAYMLTRLAPGVMDASDLHFARPMDNANLGGIVTNGVQGGNEYTIDGAPNMSNARGVGFSPPSDAIAEFKVQTNAFDAQSGHTAGAVVNLALKSGTNTLHGVAGYFNRSGDRTATPLLTERQGGVKPTRDYNRFTTTAGGPVVKGKTFFMVSYEHLRDVQPEPSTYSVPTAKMRAGDLSEFTTPIFNPFTATGSNGARTAFTNNVIPGNLINPVAAAYAGLYPAPNRDGTDNNYFTNQLRPYDYNAIMGRVDHNLTSSDRLFFTTYFNKRQEDRYNWAMDATNGTDGVINDFAVTEGYDYRSNVGFTGGYTAAMSAATLLDIRASGSRFGEYRDPGQEFDPAKLGFSSTAVQMMQGYQYLPLMTFATFSNSINANSTIASLGSQRSDFGDGFDRPMFTFSLAPTLTRFWGEHTARLGYDLRFQSWSITNNGYPGGRFHFDGSYTRASNSAPTNDRAQSWAQFMLGLPTVRTGNAAAPGTTSSQFEIAAPGEFSQWFHAVFLQDDWRVSHKMTLNLGVRLEINPGLSEAENRNLAGFDLTSSNPIEAQAQAAYARNPIPEIPVGSFKVPGGLLFADGPTYDTLFKALPRGAVSYLLNDKTVLRGGIGLFSYDLFFDNLNQQGFSQPTPVLVTNDNGLTFTGANLTNPVPSGQLVQPVGSSQGLGSSLGQNVTANSPGLGGPQLTNNLVQPNRKAPYYTRWEIGVQRDLGSGWLIEGTYIDSRGRNLPVFQDINNIPIQYLSTSRFRDPARETFLTQQVANPFQGLTPGSTINGAQVQRQQLLRPFPEFGTFGIEQYTGSDSYTAGTVHLEKRFRSGNSFTVQSTRSSTRDKLKYLNPADGVLEDRISANDRPNRLSLGASSLLPFGRGAKWGTDWNGALDAVAGGWQLSGTYQYQSGFPLFWGTSVYYDSSCDPFGLTSNIGENVNGKIAGLDMPAWDVSCFYFHDAPVQTSGVDDPAKQRADPRIQLGNNLRYFPSTLPGVRTDNLHLFDIGVYKNFSLSGDMKLQVRIEFINALNYTVLWNPQQDPRQSNFGLITQDRNNPRDIQLALRFTF